VNGANAGCLLVANKNDRTLGIIDCLSGRQVTAVRVKGNTGHEVAASPDGRFAYVPIYGDSGVGQPGSDGSNLVVIDVAARRITANFDFGHGVRPHCAVGGPDGLLYVTAELDEAVVAIDPRTLKVAASIPTGQAESHMLAVTRDGRRGFTANVGPGTVSALDLEGRRTLAVIPVSGRTQRISLSADDSLAFTADQTVARMAVIDTAEMRVTASIPLPGLGYGSAATADGKWLLVALRHENQVAVVDLDAMAVMQSIDVPASPQAVVIHPDQQVAYVSCDASAQVAALRIGTWQIEKVMAAGAGADGMAWAG
jgi:YVTN family beta-propeller protein